MGLTGIGGAALMTPFLILVVGIRPDLAIGTDLVSSIFTRTAGAWMLLETGSCRPSAYRQTRFWELAAAIVGTFVMARLDRGPLGDVRLRAAIGVVLAILGL